MTHDLAFAPALRRRGAGATRPRRRPTVWRGRIAAMALLAALNGLATAAAQDQAAAQPQAPIRHQAPAPDLGCGDPAFFGVATLGHLADDGTLTLTWTLFTAPVSTARMRPLVFVDGRLAVDLGPVDLPCEEEVVRTVADLAPEASVHAVLHNWPPVPSDLVGLSFEEAVEAYTLLWPPGTFAPADVEFWRPVGAVVVPDETIVSASRPVRPGEVPDDRVEARPGPQNPQPVADPADRLVRAPIGSILPIRLTYLAPDDAYVRATCLLDGAQVAAFDGEVTRAARLEAGRVLELTGEVPVPGPGWHRLHCLLLPDDARPDPYLPLRPILALYVWGDDP